MDNNANGAEQPCNVHLGDIEVRPSEHCLVRDGETIHLEPKVMAVLMALLRHHGEVVSRQTLLDTVWAGRVVGEEALTRCISELRAALGDKATDPRFIQTVPKRGYRLLPAPEPSAFGRRRRGYLVAAGLALVIGLATLLAWYSRLPEGPIRVAVLPFAAAAGERHLGTGIAEELINTLVGVPGLRVTSRTSAFAEFSGTSRSLPAPGPGSGEPSGLAASGRAGPRANDLQQMGRDLDVDVLLTGSVRRAADSIRLSVQLVDVSTGDHLWADTFSGPPTAVFGMQDEIIAAVTRTLGITPREPLQVTRTTSDIDALDYYLLGRHHWHERTPEGLARAVSHFRQAIEADPAMSQAYSGLADAYLLQANYDDRDAASAIALAEPLIERALALNPQSADAYASQGILLQKQGRYRDSTAALRRAIALNPNHTMARMWLGNALLALGELRAAFEHYQHAFRLDPGHPSIRHNYTTTLIELGRYAEAEALLAEGPVNQNAQGPLNGNTHVHMLARLALDRGDWDEVLRLANGMRSDPFEADMLRWRLEMGRRNVEAAETHLLAASRLAPDTERLYLAALEMCTLKPDSPLAQEILARWEERGDLSDKTALMTRALQAIVRINTGEARAAAGSLISLIEEIDQPYPPFHLRLLGHLLLALRDSGQMELFERWRGRAYRQLESFNANGWGSIEFHMERGYLLAAAGDSAAAADAFRAAASIGAPVAMRLAGDPRTAGQHDLLKEFI